MKCEEGGSSFPLPNRLGGSDSLIYVLNDQNQGNLSAQTTALESKQFCRPCMLYMCIVEIVGAYLMLGHAHFNSNELF